jgi:hypothetical protein
VDIKAGDEVTISYLPPIIGNVRRRSKIKRSWHFECACTRFVGCGGKSLST